MKLFTCIIFAIITFTISGCGGVGVLSDNKSYTGDYIYKFKQSRPDCMNKITEVCKVKGFDVSGRLGDTVKFTNNNSMMGTMLVGSFSQTNLDFQMTENGKAVKVTAFLMGNFGSGTEDAAQKLVDGVMTNVAEKYGVPLSAL